MPRILVAAALAALLLAPPIAAEPARPPGDAILLTIFLRHDQSRPLGELNAQLTKNGWYDEVPAGGDRGRELVRGDGDRTSGRCGRSSSASGSSGAGALDHGQGAGSPLVKI